MNAMLLVAFAVIGGTQDATEWTNSNGDIYVLNRTTHEITFNGRFLGKGFVAGDLHENDVFYGRGGNSTIWEHHHSRTWMDQTRYSEWPVAEDTENDDFLANSVVDSEGVAYYLQGDRIYRREADDEPVQIGKGFNELRMATDDTLWANAPNGTVWSYHRDWQFMRKQQPQWPPQEVEFVPLDDAPANALRDTAGVGYWLVGNEVFRTDSNGDAQRIGGGFVEILIDGDTLWARGGNGTIWYYQRDMPYMRQDTKVSWPPTAPRPPPTDPTPPPTDPVEPPPPPPPPPQDPPEPTLPERATQNFEGVHYGMLPTGPRPLVGPEGWKRPAPWRIVDGYRKSNVSKPRIEPQEVIDGWWWGTRKTGKKYDREVVDAKQ